jgi:hypothetical protein
MREWPSVDWTLASAALDTDPVDKPAAADPLGVQHLLTDQRTDAAFIDP